jgi:hypothetical protein
MKIYSLKLKKKIFVKKLNVKNEKKQSKLVGELADDIKKKLFPQEHKPFKVVFEYDEREDKYIIEEEADRINLKKLRDNLFVEDYQRFETFEDLEKDIKKYRQFRLIFYSSFVLYNYYVFLGFSRFITNPRNGGLLLGYYAKIAMINLEISQSALRAHLTFMLTVLIKRFVSFIIINEIYNEVIIHGYINMFAYYRMGYYFGRWWKGFFKNYRLFKDHPSVAFAWYNFIGLFPYYSIFLHVPRFNPKSSVVLLNAELGKMQKMRYSFYDTAEPSQFVTNGILSNNKNYLNNLFYLKIIISFIVKVNFFKKKKFMDNFFYSSPEYKFYFDLLTDVLDNLNWRDKLVKNFDKAWTTKLDKRLEDFKFFARVPLTEEFFHMYPKHIEIYFSILSLLKIKKKIDRYSFDFFKYKKKY